MAITASMVKELRERTGLGMMDCKKALTEAGGDMEKAIEDLRKSSALKAAKKAGRTTADGLLGIKIGADDQQGTIVEINIETDFAAKNEKFIAFVGKALDIAFAAQANSVDAVMTDELSAEREALVQEIGENITVRRVQSLTASNGIIASYLHSDKRKGAIVQLTGSDQETAKDVAMHITAINPMVVNAEQVPADVLNKEREIFSSQAAESGKPPEIVEKMVEGRVRKFLAEVSLLDQPFVKDGNVKVSNLLKEKGMSCEQFARFEVGEGIEVAEEDFAAEVAAQVKGSS